MTQLPGGLGSIDFTDWFRGLVAAFVGGGAGAVSAGFSVIVQDPHDYNIYTRKLYTLMLTCFLINGLLSAMAFLHQRPVPELKMVKTTVETAKTEGKPTVTVRTVEETHVESMPMPKEEPK